MTKKDAERAIPKLIAQLGKQYGKSAPPEPTEESLEHLILLILLERTSERRAERALKQLRARFVDWNEVRVSAAFEIDEAIKDVEDARTKAERIRRILEGIFAKQNVLSLKDLDDMPPEKALRYLSSIDGIAWKDAAQLMLAHYDHPVLPVDEGVARVASRIGLCPESNSIQETRKALEPLAPERSFWEFFRLCQFHAEDTCIQGEYRCAKCTLAKQCETGDPEVGPRRKRKQRPRRGSMGKSKTTNRRGTSATKARKRPAKKPR